MAEQSKIKAFVRVCQTDLEGKKPISQALTKIFGVSQNFAKAICNILKIEKGTVTGTISDDVAQKIEKVINEASVPEWMKNRRKDLDTGVNKHVVGSRLRLSKDFDIKRLRKIKCYVGMRHSYGLPVHGQRTKSNFRKGGKAMGVQKKKGK